jgi:hypothetical protein
MLHYSFCFYLRARRTIYTTIFYESVIHLKSDKIKVIIREELYVMHIKECLNILSRILRVRSGSHLCFNKSMTAFVEEYPLDMSVSNRKQKLSFQDIDH